MRDKSVIAAKVDSYHIKLPIDSLFSDINSKIRVGTLLWVYSSFTGFDFQWILIMVFYTLLVGVAAYTGLMTKLYLLYIYSGEAIFLIGPTLYLFCFSLRPRGMGVYYWILPFIPILGLLFIYIKKLPKKGQATI